MSEREKGTRLRSTGATLQRLIFQALLRLHSRSFRERYADGMWATFVERDREFRRVGGGGRYALFNAREALDLVRSAVMDRGSSAHRGSSAKEGRDSGDFFATLGADLRLAVRGLAKSPGFTTLVVLTVGLGVGANTAIFSLVNGILLKGQPYSDPDRLAFLFHGYGTDQTRNWVSPLFYRDYKDRNDLFEGTAAYTPVSFNLTVGDESVRISGAEATVGLFDLLDVTPTLGRRFQPEETVAGSNVALITQDLWQRLFGSDPALVGRTIALDGRPFTVVGVLPESFDLLPSADVWTPLVIPPEMYAANRRGSEYLLPVVRVRSGVTLERAEEELTGLIEDVTPMRFGMGQRAHLVSLHEQVVGPVRPALRMLLGAGAFVLLIVCANLASLLMVRSEARHREVAIRVALGAGRGRIVRMLLTESLLLAGLGGVLGVAVAWASVEAITTLNLGALPRLAEVVMDWRVLGFAMAVSVVTGVAFGLEPSLRASRLDQNTVLRGGGARSTGTVGVRRIRTALVVGEVALALMLATGAALMVQSMSQTLAVDPGFQSDGILTVRFTLSENQYPDPAERAEFFTELAASVEALPGVVSVGFATDLPLTGVRNTASYFLSGEPMSMEVQPPSANMRAVSEFYFATMGIRLVEGRTFTTTDSVDERPVVIIDELIARRHWPDRSPIGQSLDGVFGATGAIVVGVAGEVKDAGLTEDSFGHIYAPLAQVGPNTATLAIRTAGDPVSLAPSVREVVRGIDNRQPLYDVQTMDQLLEATVSRSQLTLIIVALMGTLAVVLAALGIYGTMSHTVSQRIGEFGIRKALGAEKSTVLRMVLGQALQRTLLGVALGITGAAALSRVLASFLFGISPVDPSTLLLVSAGMGLLSVLASALPAWKAMRVEASVALRAEA